MGISNKIMAIQAERWEKVKAVFVEALELTPSAQAVFLRNNCPDEEVRAEVERLLTEHQKAGSFLPIPPCEAFRLNLRQKMKTW